MHCLGRDYGVVSMPERIQPAQEADPAVIVDQ
jgi:hypothetical protein